MRKNNKRALIVSALSLLLCVSMLVGSTMAWFTDNASTSVNKIVSGELDVALKMLVNGEWVDAEGETLGFVDDEGNLLEEILWEPGCSYLLQPFQIVNEGNLALKFDVVVNGIAGDVKLAEAIEYGMPLGDVNDLQFYPMGDLNDFDSIFDAVEEANLTVLEPGDEFNTAEDEITFHMKETAGNEYQGLTITGFSILVRATQATVEEDSFNNQYDANAEYDKMVASTDELKAALEAGESVLLNGNVTLEETVTLSNSAIINLNGNTLTLSGEALNVKDGNTLTVAGGSVHFADGETLGVLNVENSTEGTTTTLNLVDVNLTAGENEDAESNGIVAEAEAGNVVVNISGNTNIFSDAQHNAPIVVGKNATVVMNSGTIHASQPGEPNSWTSLYGVLLDDSTAVFTMNGGTIKADGQNTASGICANSGTVNLNGGTIDVTAGNTQYGYSIGIEAYEATLNLNGGTINVMSPGAYDAEALDVTSKTTINYDTATSTLVVNLYKSIWSGNRVSEDDSVNAIITGIVK